MRPKVPVFGARGMNAVARTQRQAVLLRLRRLADHLQAGTPLNREDRDLLSKGLEGFLSPGSPTSLDQALGLRSRGGASVRTTILNTERDALLRHLAREDAAWCRFPASLAAKEMRRAFDNYERGRWRREGSASVAPAFEPNATFWRLLKAGMRMPQERRLSQILNEIQYPV